MARNSQPIVAIPKVGILHSGSDAQHRQQIAALLAGLGEEGYVDGDNVTVVGPLYSDDDATTLKTNATTLVTTPVDVIITAGGSVSALAAKAANTAAGTTIPIVFTTVTDPVAGGLVASLDEPGGNITGTAGLCTSELDPQRLELLQEFSPTSTTIGVLTNSTRAKFALQKGELQAAATKLGLTLELQDATKPADIDNAINNFSAAVKAILVTADPMFNNQRKKVIRLIKAKGLPAIYQWREFPASGGLMSYGPSLVSAYQQAGVYAGRILDGNKPQNLPVELPKNYELVINFRAATKAGFKIPTSMLTRAVLIRRK